MYFSNNIETEIKLEKTLPKNFYLFRFLSDDVKKKVWLTLYEKAVISLFWEKSDIFKVENPGKGQPGMELYMPSSINTKRDLMQQWIV